MIYLATLINPPPVITPTSTCYTLLINLPSAVTIVRTYNISSSTLRLSIPIFFVSSTAFSNLSVLGLVDNFFIYPMKPLSTKAKHAICIKISSIEPTN